MARRITFARACVGVTSKPVTAHTIYATILVKAANIAWTEQRLHTDRTYQTLLYYLQTECPKRETIRVARPGVKQTGTLRVRVAIERLRISQLILRSPFISNPSQYKNSAKND